jgi:hypothetical protein
VISVASPCAVVRHEYNPHRRSEQEWHDGGRPLLAARWAGGENKNRHVFEYCAALVQRGVFKNVKISFLPGVHTHEFFGPVAVAIPIFGDSAGPEVGACLIPVTMDDTPVQ